MTTAVNIIKALLVIALTGALAVGLIFVAEKADEWLTRAVLAAWGRLRTHYSGGHINLDEDAVNETIAEMERLLADGPADDQQETA